jgi:hypothetical protein
MVRMGHSSSAAALRYQHVIAGRDAAIAAALDELIQAAAGRSQDPAAAVVAHGWHERSVWPEGPAPMIGRDGCELGEWLVGLAGLEPAASS